MRLTLNICSQTGLSAAAIVRCDFCTATFYRKGRFYNARGIEERLFHVYNCSLVCESSCEGVCINRRAAGFVLFLLKAV